MGAEIAVLVAPKASRNLVREDCGPVRIGVTVAAEGGKANRAVTKLLARALGIAPSRLVLLRGASARDKVFRIT